MMNKVTKAKNSQNKGGKVMKNNKRLILEIGDKRFIFSPKKLFSSIFNSPFTYFVGLYQIVCRPTI